MSATNDRGPNEPESRSVPPQGTPPAPELQTVIPPTDPLGFPAQPVPATAPIRDDDDQPAKGNRFTAFVVLLLVVAAIVLLAWLGS